MKYSHIFFDWHGVLSKSTYFSHVPEFKVIEKHWLTTHKALLKKWAKGECDVDEFIDELSGSTNLHKAYLTQSLKVSCETQVFVSDQIPNLINRLRSKGIVCVIATDNYDVFDKWIVPALSLDTLFDDILNSYNLKHMKSELETDYYSPFFSKYLRDHSVHRSLWLDDIDMSFQAKVLGIDFKLIRPVDNLVSVFEDLLA